MDKMLNSTYKQVRILPMALLSYQPHKFRKGIQYVVAEQGKQDLSLWKPEDARG
jgi:hypothetical protein